MIDNIDIESLINQMHAIYEDQISYRVNSIHKEDFTKKELEEQYKVIKTGFNIFIFLQILRDFQD